MRRLVLLSVMALAVLAGHGGCEEIEYEKRHKDNPCVTLETNHGTMTLELYRDVAPAHVDSFVARTVEGFYDSTIFHRIIDQFMIQGGQPRKGSPNVDYTLDLEPSDVPHREGTLAMARTPDPNSAGTQFYIVLTQERTKHLDGQYTVFGHLISGYEVLHEIGAVKTNKSVPLEPVVLTKAFMSDVEGNPEKE